MLFKVNGQATVGVLFNESEVEDRECFNILSRKKIENALINVEAVQFLQLSSNEVSVSLEENFDDGCDDKWHGWAEFKANVSALVEADSEQNALDLMNSCYDDMLDSREMDVFMDGGVMLQLDPEDSTYITWKTATVHEGETPEGASIVIADLH